MYQRSISRIWCSSFESKLDMRSLDTPREFEAFGVFVDHELSGVRVKSYWIKVMSIVSTAGVKISLRYSIIRLIS